MRHILHCDMNAFYVSVEIQRHPELRGKPVAVCGSQEERHGIVLTANYIAKPRGVKTGMAIWQAKQVCPDLVTLPPEIQRRVVLAPHLGGITEASFRRAHAHMWRNAQRLAAGERPDSVVNGLA